jgi:outer membrane biosynthesis protein TonB
LAKRLGPRFGLEAGFLIGVAVVLGLLEVSWPAIVAAMALAWLLVAAAEVAAARARPAKPPAAAPAEPAPSPEAVVPPLPPPFVLVEPAPVPVPVPVREPEPEPEPVAPPPAAPPPSPFPVEPREWNLWELERIAREHAGADPARDDERTYLLLSLRDFAEPDGNLPVEFDQLVRDAFGDLLQTTA